MAKTKNKPGMYTGLNYDPRNRYCTRRNHDTSKSGRNPEGRCRKCMALLAEQKRMRDKEGVTWDSPTHYPDGKKIQARTQYYVHERTFFRSMGIFDDRFIAGRLGLSWESFSTLLRRLGVKANDPVARQEWLGMEEPEIESDRDPIGPLDEDLAAELDEIEIEMELDEEPNAVQANDSIDLDLHSYA